MNTVFVAAQCRQRTRRSKSAHVAAWAACVNPARSCFTQQLQAETCMHLQPRLPAAYVRVAMPSAAGGQ